MLHSLYPLYENKKDKLKKKVKVTMARSKVKSRSHHDGLHLHTLTNVPTKYQLSTPYGFQDIPRQDFIGQGHYSKVKGQIKVSP